MQEVATRLGYGETSWRNLYRFTKQYGIVVPGTPTDQIRRTIDLTQRQRDLIVGTLLGDSSISKIRNRFRNHYLSFTHAARYRKYAEWKAAELAPFSRPFWFGKTTNKVRPRLSGFDAILFQTITHPAFEAFRHLFYLNGKKHIPDNIADLLTPLGLAVWYMDDGTLRWWHTKRGAYAEFCTERFPITEQEVLVTALQTVFSFRPRTKKTSYGHSQRIFLDWPDTQRFASVVRPHIIPSMLYKLP